MKRDQFYTSVNLQQLINRLIGFYQSVANTHNSYFSAPIIQSNLYIKTDAEALGTFLGSLFHIVARCSRDSAILISAASYQHRVAISLQCSGRADRYLIQYGFAHLELLAGELGGCLDISKYSNRETTITVDFADSPLLKKSVPFENCKGSDLPQRSDQHYHI